MTRPVIRWDRDAQEWVVTIDLVRVAAFSKLYEAEHYVIDLDAERVES